MATNYAQYMSNWAAKRLGVPPDRITIDMLRTGISDLRRSGALRHGNSGSLVGGRVHCRLKRRCNTKGDVAIRMTDAELDAYLSSVLAK